jgi:hypothetical protein
VLAAGIAGFSRFKAKAPGLDIINRVEKQAARWLGIQFQGKPLRT